MIKKIIFSVIILISAASCTRDSVNEPVDNDSPPSIPSDISVYVERDGIVGIEWHSSSGFLLSHFNIYRSINDTLNYSFRDSVSSNFYLEKGLEYDSVYYYKVTAVNRNGLESGYSNTINARPANKYTPLTPRFLNVKGRNWNDSAYFYLEWEISEDGDIAGYEVHRGTTASFTTGPQTLVKISSNNFTTDEDNAISILNDYYYKIIVVDKAGLKSDPTLAESDIILDMPVLIFPSDNSETRDFARFEFITCGYPAEYKLLIQTNEIFGTVQEINFSSDKINQPVKVNYNSFYIDANKKYYWRIYAYTKSGTDPNSFSKLNSFIINPDL